MNEITADTITDAQIRALKATPDYRNVRPDTEYGRALYRTGLFLTCDHALDAGDPDLRERARARCAEILNARADAQLDDEEPEHPELTLDSEDRAYGESDYEDCP